MTDPNDNYIYFRRDECHNPVISARYKGQYYKTIIFQFYTKKEALTEYRRKAGLTGKHLRLIEKLQIK